MSRIRTAGFTATMLLAGGASAQFQPNPVLTDIPANTALDLGEYLCDPIEGEWLGLCQRVTDYSGFVYDKHRHRMLLFGGGHSTTMRDDIDVFDFGSLTWNSLYEPTPCDEMIQANFDGSRAMWLTTGHASARHTYDLMVVTEQTGDFVLMRGGGNAGAACARFNQLGGEVAHYDFNRGEWIFSGQRYLWERFASAEVDPVSGIVVIRSNEGLYTYDPVSQAALEVDPANRNMGIANNLVYFPPNDKMYLIQRGAGTPVWEITLDRGNWANTTTELVTGVAGDIPDSQESGWAYDSVSEVIGGGVKDGVFYAFDPITKKWESAVMEADSSAGLDVGTVAFHALDFDPINGVFLFITNGSSGRRTWAYRYRDSCYADCTPVTGVGVLDIFDFICFQDAFVSGEPFADCDGSGTLDVLDFICFQDSFVGGCS